MPHAPVFLHPALPSEVLSYVVTRCSHPDTVIICRTKEDFLSALTSEAIPGVTNAATSGPEITTGSITAIEAHSSAQNRHEDIPPRRQAASSAASASLRQLSTPLSLYQVAIARHIRIAFVPTVTHLRAFLAVFDPADSKVPAPPAASRRESGGPTRGATATHGVELPATAPRLPWPGNRKRKAPLLLVYGFLELHRDTSEWSAQGLGSTSGVLVEMAARFGFRAAIVEPQSQDRATSRQASLAQLLAESMPILHGSARKSGTGQSGWTGRTVDVRTVLGRWFRFPITEM